MNCPACGHENRDQARFCEECAAPLTPSCPNCGTQLRPGAKFCDECANPLTAQKEPTPQRDPRAYTPKHLADRILQSKSALEGERKQVTVLFADVKGSMDLAAELDPEEWHRILGRFFQILSDGVHRFEGTVNQYTGDGIMALFGAPIAHEDHAQRACYAALHLSDEIRSYADDLRRTRGLSFSVRMGLNSGEVVVGKIGDDLRMDYTAQGHTVGLAARMQEIAEPRSIYLTADTARLIEGFFDLRDLEAFHLKGVRESVRVYELEGVGKLRTRLDVSRSRGFSRFVGRVEEMQILETALGRAQAGSPQIIGIVGEAGVGKSRLCFEFLERCRARGIMVNETHGVAHGKSIPLLPILKLFRAFYGITEQDSAVTAREKIAGRLLLLDERFRDVLPLVFDLLGVADPDRPPPRMDPEARQRQLVSVVRGVVQARAGRETTVTLLEDLHWFDKASEAFVEPLLEAPPEARSLVVLNFRPEYHAPWMQGSHYQQVPLLPLGAEAIRDLLIDLLGNDPSLAGLAELVQERTGGNPFFIEEVVHSLVEAGHLEGTRGDFRLVRAVADVLVPDTVQAVLAARIDRLHEREKQLLQTAAVIGKTVPEPILAEVAELPRRDLASALSSLKAGEFIYEQALYPAAEYAFKHPLTQEVALGSQLKERRARVHAAVARAIEVASRDKLDEQAALLAYHWEEAGNRLEAARWHRRAGEWAGTTNPAEGSRHWHRVRALVRELPGSPETADLGMVACRWLMNMAWRLGSTPEDLRTLLEEGRRFAETVGDLAAHAALLAAYGRAQCGAGNIGEHLEVSREAVRLAIEADDFPAMAGAWVGLSDAHNWSGNAREALSVVDEAFERLPEDFDVGAELFGASSYGILSLEREWALSNLGRLEEAEQQGRTTLQIAAQTDGPELRAWTHLFFAFVSFYRGDASSAMEHAQRLLEEAEKAGNPPHLLGNAHDYLNLAHLLAGRWDEAAESARSGLVLRRQRGADLANIPFGLLNLSRALLGGGAIPEATRAAAEAIAESLRSHRQLVEAEAQTVLARALARSNPAAEEIDSALARAEALLERTGALVVAPQIAEARAEVAARRGDTEGRALHLREAHRLFTEMAATGHAERVARELVALGVTPDVGR